jgi:hypothetical protein
MVQHAKSDYQIEAAHITTVRGGITNAELTSPCEVFLSIGNVSLANVNAKIIYTVR